MTPQSPSASAWHQSQAHDALRALRAEYAKEVPSRVRRLARALRAWRRAPADAPSMERARVLAHRLRGTAGSYGFAAMGEAAGRVEDGILRAVSAPVEAHDAAWAELWTALRAAEAVAAEVGT